MAASSSLDNNKKIKIIVSHLKNNPEIIDEIFEIISGKSSGSRIVDIYTDGSCDMNKDIGGIGIYSPFLKWKFSIPYNSKMRDQYGKPTNNKCELLAIGLSFKKILDKCADLLGPSFNINIISDSEYSIKCVTQWIDKWKKNNWMNSKGSPVLNKDIIESIDNLKSKITEQGSSINFHHTMSHGKKGFNPKFKKGNDIADKLAVSASSSKKQIK